MKEVNDSKIVKRTLSKQFYDYAQTLVTVIPDSICRVQYQSPVHFPNMLRNNEEDRRVIITSISIIQPKTVKELFGYIDEDEELEIHVCTVGGIMTSSIQFHRYKDILEENASYRIKRNPKEIDHSVLVFNDLPVFLVGEIYKKSPNSLKMRIDSFPAWEGSDTDYQFSDVTLKNGLSFLKKNMPITELRERIIFMNTKYVASIGGKLLPLNTALMNYNGELLLDVTITPRYQVQSDAIENSRLGDMDQWECTSKVHEIVFGKILVGFNLANEMEALLIEIGNICGMRDLSNAKCLEGKFAKNGCGLSLPILVRDILDKQASNCYSTAKEDVNDIRTIYLKFENSWIDLIRVTEITENNLQSNPVNCKEKYLKDSTTKNKVGNRVVKNKSITFLNIEQEIGPEPNIDLGDETEHDDLDCQASDDGLSAPASVDDSSIVYTIKKRRIGDTLFHPVRVIYESEDGNEKYIENLNFDFK